MTTTSIMASTERDPIDVMVDIMDGFSEYVLRTEEAVLRGRRYRLNLLWVHAVYALLMGPAFMSLGPAGVASTAFTHLRQIPGSYISVGGTLTVGGFILGIGCILRNRRVEQFGLVLLIGFYFTICVIFSWANIDWYTGRIGGNKPAPYAPVLYAHLTTIMIIHWWTLRNLLRQGLR